MSRITKEMPGAVICRLLNALSEKGTDPGLRNVHFSP
jgi:hypothetical protein